MSEQLRDYIPSPATLFDLSLIGLIAGLLVAVHLGLPSELRAELAFHHEEFVLWTLITSAYVHVGGQHLLQNVAGFFGVTIVAYVLILDLDARQWFRIMTVVLSVVLPIFVGLSSYAILTWVAPQAAPVERGFSGVVAGFIGFTLAAFVVWVRDRTSLHVAQYVGQAVVILLVWELSLIYSGVNVLILLLVGVGMGLTGWGLHRQRRALSQWWRDSRGDVLVGGVVVGVLLLFMRALFPADFTGGEQTVNIFAHAAGFVWGAVCAFAVRYLER